MKNKIIVDMLKESNQLREYNFETNNPIISIYSEKDNFQFNSVFDMIDTLRYMILNNPNLSLNDVKNLNIYNQINTTLQKRDLRFFPLSNSGYNYLENSNSEDDLIEFAKDFSFFDIYNSTNFKNKNGNSLVLDNLLNESNPGYISFIDSNREIYSMSKDFSSKYNLGSSFDLYITSDVESQRFFLSNGLKVNNNVYSLRSIILDVNSIEAIKNTCLFIENNGLKLTDIIEHLNN